MHIAHTTHTTNRYPFLLRTSLSAHQLGYNIYINSGSSNAWEAILFKSLILLRLLFETTRMTLVQLGARVPRLDTPWISNAPNLPYCVQTLPFTAGCYPYSSPVKRCRLVSILPDRLQIGCSRSLCIHYCELTYTVKFCKFPLFSTNVPDRLYFVY